MVPGELNSDLCHLISLHTQFTHQVSHFKTNRLHSLGQPVLFNQARVWQPRLGCLVSGQPRGRGRFPGRWHRQPSAISRPLHHRLTLRYGSADGERHRRERPTVSPASLFVWRLGDRATERRESAQREGRRGRGRGGCTVLQEPGRDETKTSPSVQHQRETRRPRAGLFIPAVFTLGAECVCRRAAVFRPRGRPDSVRDKVRHKQELCVSV